MEKAVEGILGLTIIKLKPMIFRVTIAALVIIGLVIIRERIFNLLADLFNSIFIVIWWISGWLDKIIWGKVV